MNGERIPLAQARRLALELAEILRPAVERIEIAGSIRRERPTVGDIELVAVPRLEPVRDMFGEPTGSRNALDDLAADLLARGTISLRYAAGPLPTSAWGARYKKFVYRDVKVDLFSVLPPAQFGVLLVIRTGPAEFSRRFVTERRKGGMLPEWAIVREGAIWRRVGDRPAGQPMEMAEEEDAFRFLGVEPIPPSWRVSWESWPRPELAAVGS